MEAWHITLLSFVVCTALMWIFDSDKKDKLKLAELFSNRAVRSDEDYDRTFFKNSSIDKDVVTQVRRIFIEQLGENYDLLEPDDDWTADYLVIWNLDSFGYVELMMALEEEFEIKISDAEAAEMRSLRDITEMVSAKLAKLDSKESDKGLINQ